MREGLRLRSHPSCNARICTSRLRQRRGVAVKNVFVNVDGSQGLLKVLAVTTEQLHPLCNAPRHVFQSGHVHGVKAILQMHFSFAELRTQRDDSDKGQWFGNGVLSIQVVSPYLWGAKPTSDCSGVSRLDGRPSR
eukprot:scaffold63_cov306-Pinguiococcus_pyrenoidosus.AAC.40